MNPPFPNISVEFNIKSYYELTEVDTQTIKQYSDKVEVTNYEYEVKKNEDKRQILILKKEYLGALVSDLKNIMKYAKSSQYVDDKTKRV